MNFFSKFVDFFGKGQAPPTEPSESCPMCWGWHEYQDEIKIVYEDKQRDVKNHKDHYVKSLKFVKENIDGMAMKKGEIIKRKKTNKQQ